MLSSAIEAYAVVSTVQPERFRVSCAPAKGFSRALSAVTRSLGDEIASPMWELVLSSARAARWRAGAEGVPFDAPTSGAREPLTALLAAVARLEGLVDGHERAALQKLTNAAKKYLEENNRALAGAVLACVRDGDPADTCVIGGNQRTVRAIAGWLKQQQVTAPVVTPREFVTGRRWDFAVVVGASDWFPSQTFTCSRAETITLVHHAHLLDSSEVQGIFESYATVPLAIHLREGPAPQQNDEGSDPEDESAEEQTLQPHWPSLIRQALPDDQHESTVAERVEARLVVLADGYGVWIPVDAVAVRGLDLTAAPGERVVQVRTALMSVDSVLILREGDSDNSAIAQMADAELGVRAAAIRGKQRRWKVLLRQELARVGQAGLVRKLRDLGATTANLRYWASEESIRPLRDGDFALLLKYLGIDEPVEYLAEGRLLWQAHHRAGVKLAAALEQALESADLSVLEQVGRQQLQLAGGDLTATLTAFRVVAVHDRTHEIPAGATRRPFKLKGSSWLE